MYVRVYIRGKSECVIGTRGQKANLEKCVVVTGAICTHPQTFPEKTAFITDISMRSDRTTPDHKEIEREREREKERK